MLIKMMGKKIFTILRLKNCLSKSMIDSFQDKQKLLQTQQKLINDLRLAVHSFGSQNPSVSVDGFLQKLQDVEVRTEKLHFR